MMDDKLWLDPIPPILHEQAREAFQNGDGLGFLLKAPNTDSLMLVWNNVGPLRERDIYERTLLWAITTTRTNNWSFPEGCLKLLLSIADRAKLLAADDPLPGPGPFTLYRGVAGNGRARRIRGISWTATLERAIWFANRFPHLKNPTVYIADVETALVLAYVGSHRGEDEYIVDLPRSFKVRAMHLPA
jgi:hypothetical protein